MKPSGGTAKRVCELGGGWVSGGMATRSLAMLITATIKEAKNEIIHDIHFNFSIFGYRL
jgi:hypothetical protein